jgi:hypothetical protein
VDVGRSSVPPSKEPHAATNCESEIVIDEIAGARLLSNTLASSSPDATLAT